MFCLCVRVKGECVWERERVREDREWRMSRTSEGELRKMLDCYLFDATIFNLIFNNNNSSHFYSTISHWQGRAHCILQGQQQVWELSVKHKFPWQENDNYWSVCCQLQNCAACCFVKKNQNWPHHYVSISPLASQIIQYKMNTFCYNCKCRYVLHYPVQFLWLSSTLDPPLLLWSDELCFTLVWTVWIQLWSNRLCHENVAK